MAARSRASISPQDVYYQRPRWSPDGTRIAFHVTGGGSPRIAVYDVAANRITAETALPARDPNVGGKCGDMWLVESRDARFVLYSYTDGVPGTNGVWAVLSGEQHLVKASQAGRHGGRTAGSRRVVVRRFDDLRRERHGAAAHHRRPLAGMVAGITRVPRNIGCAGRPFTDARRAVVQWRTRVIRSPSSSLTAAAWRRVARRRNGDAIAVALESGHAGWRDVR
jgi:hypothetical protein